MKSLEIVNKKLKYLEKYRFYTQITDINENEAQQIKQDLDVLEIIRKKKVNLDHLKYCIEEPFKGDCDPIELILFTYNFCMKAEKKLTLEELQKLKQWLEENENGKNKVE